MNRVVCNVGALRIILGFVISEIKVKSLEVIVDRSNSTGCLLRSSFSRIAIEIEYLQLSSVSNSYSTDHLDLRIDF